MSQSNGLFRINTEALTHPPVSPGKMPQDATVIYIAKPNAWSYGCGALFKFVFENGNLNEIPIKSLDSIGKDFVVDLLSRKNVFYFEYAADRNPAWIDKTADFRSFLVTKIQPGQLEKHIF